MTRRERGLFSPGVPGEMMLCFWQSDADTDLLALRAVPERVSAV